MVWAALAWTSFFVEAVLDASKRKLVPFIVLLTYILAFIAYHSSLIHLIGGVAGLLFAFVMYVGGIFRRIDITLAAQFGLFVGDPFLIAIGLAILPLVNKIERGQPVAAILFGLAVFFAVIQGVGQ